MSHRFKKQFGQNFLRHDKFARKLIQTADIKPGDNIIEIGPGEGRITRLLLEEAKPGKVTVIEIDYDLVVKLIKQFNDYPNFEILHEDILKVDIKDNDYKVIGALPYNISKQIIYKLFQKQELPQQMAFIMQEEVVNAFVAKPPQASFLSCWLRLRADVKKVCAIPKTQFYPVPKVNGGIIQIKPYQLTESELNTVKKITKLIKIGFSSPRKTLWNNLKAADLFDKESLAAAWQQLNLKQQRPAEVDLQTWKQLSSKLEAFDLT